MRRRTMVVLAAAGVVVAAPLGAYGYLAFTTRDTPAPASLGLAPDAGAAAGGGPDSPDGTWTVAEVSTNFVGYRIRERLGPVAAPSDAVARTSQVDGTVRIEGPHLTALDISVDIAALDSGSPRRDERVRGPILDTAQYPTAEFHLTEPVEDEAPRRDRVVELSVPGELTLRGETREISFDVRARWNGSTIQAAGTTQIQRADFGIDVSSLGYNIDEEGTIEFELTFTPQGESVGAPPPTLADSSIVPTEEGEFQPPCQSDDTTLTLDPPVLVTGGTPDTLGFEVITAAQQVAIVQSSSGLTGGTSWSPDGSEVVYSSSPTVDEPRALAVVPATGGTPTPVPGLTGATQPDWGPDGRIVYVQATEQSTSSDIWVTNRDGQAQPLVETPGLDSDPRWSPDGRTVVFTTAAGANNQDIVAVGREGSGLKTLVSSPDYEYAPSFTPDGEGLLFVRDGSIFIADTDGSGSTDGAERRLTDGPSDVNPAMSPDGERLAFIRKGSLFVADADGSAPACVVTNQSISGGPRWRP